MAHNIWALGQAATDPMVCLFTSWEAAFFFSLFSSFLSYFLSALVSKAKTWCRELQKEICKHLGQPGLTKIQMNTEPLTAACMCCPGADLFPLEWVSNPARCAQHTICFRGNHIVLHSWETNCTPLNKTDGQIQEGNSSLLPRGGGTELRA
jgi:hypothetical protein